MQNVGEQQFLVLLLVIETDLDNWHQRVEFLRGADQCGDRGIDMGAVVGDFGSAGRVIRPRSGRAWRGPAAT